MESTPVKDPNRAHPIPELFRITLREIVQALVRGSYNLEPTPRDVSPVLPSTAEQIRDYVMEYGETLVDIPEEAWDFSVCQWMESYWDILLDLWTAESGRSDLVLSVRVLEHGQEFRFEVDSVHVP